MKKLFLALILGFTFLFGAVNINTASKEELASLKGIGEKTAEYIIEYRKDNEFKSIEDLKNVKGIGEKKFEAIKKDITVSGKTSIDDKKENVEKKDKSKKDKNKKDKK